MKARSWFGKTFHPLREKIQSDPYYRFQSAEEIAIAAELGVKINVSHAGVDDWLRLPGISIHQARALVALVGSGVEILSIEDLAAALSVPAGRLKAIEPILEFAYYNPESLLSPAKIDPNTATIARLTSIAFITPELAEKIIRQREERGKYKDLVDFQRRLSLDSSEISQLMHFLRF